MKRIRAIALIACSALLPLLDLNAAPTFTIQGGTLTAVELNGESEIIIPDGVTVIVDYAFRNCHNLTSLIIPASVTGIGGAAFYGCSNLSHITFIGDKLSLGSENLSYIARNCAIESNGHYNGTYYDPSSNIRWTINDGWLTGIGLNGETRITIPSVVTSIGNALRGRSELKSVTIPSGVTTIVDGAFDGCRSLGSIEFKGNAPTCNSLFFHDIPYGCEVIVPRDSTGWGVEEGELWRGLVLRYASNVEWIISDFGDLQGVNLNGEKDIRVPNGVASIRSRAFAGCNELTSVIIPDSVMFIEYDAFADCCNLTNVTIGAGVRSIYSGAFRNCESLTCVTIRIGSERLQIDGYAFDGCADAMTIIIDAGVTLYGGVAIPRTTIDDYAFHVCPALMNHRALMNMTISDSVTSIGYDAFAYCSGLTNVTIGSNVTQIGDFAFQRCSGLMSVTIPDGVTSIGSFAFSGCSSMTGVTIPDSVTSIGSRAFADCIGLTNITISSNVTRIEDYAFQGCRGLTSVTIPGGVTSIGVDAFIGCSSLTNITVDADNANYMAVDGLLLSKDGATLILCANQSECISIPDGVKIIGNKAFENCRSLKNVLIPDGVTSIGDLAFYGCISLTRVTIPDSVTNIGNQAFRDCSGLADASGFVIVRNVLYSYHGAGYDIAIPAGVTCIEDYAFNKCSSITSIAIPKGIMDIGTYAFRSCSGVTNIVVEAGNANYSSANGLLLSKDGTTLIQGINGDVVIPDGVTNIVAYAFFGCSNLTSLKIPDSVTSIGVSAFVGCNGLSDIVVPECVCTNRMSSLFPSAYSSITNVVVSDNVTNIGNDVFSGCSSLSNVSIGNGVTNIGAYAFYNCSSLTEVAMPVYVIGIGASAFARCGQLSLALLPIHLKGSVSQSNQFENCASDFQLVFYEGSVCDIEYITVCFDANGGTVSTDRISAVAGAFANTNAFPVAEREGYSFSGWWTFPDGGVLYTDTSILSESVKAYAHWSAKEYTLSFLANGGVCDMGSKTVIYGGLIGQLPNATRDGYKFIGWFTELEGGVQFCQTNTVSILEDTPCYAHWTGNEYTVNLNANGGMCNVASMKVVYGERIGRLPSATRDGFSFMGWFSDQEGGVLISQTSQATMLEDTTYYAHWVCNWSYVVKPDGTVEITGHNIDVSGMVALPSSIDGRIVTSIGDHAFQNCSSMEGIIIPKGVVSIGQKAFAGSSLHSVFFKGNRPSVGTGIFDDIEDLPTVYVSRTAAGWDGYLFDCWQSCFVTYARPFFAFHNASVFRTGIDVFEVVTNICAIEQQPIVGDLIGVQTEFYIDSVLEDDLSEAVDTNSISVYMAYCLEESKWGIDSWCKDADWHKLTKVETNYVTAGNFICFRSSPSELTSYIPPQMSPTVVQYALMVAYRDLVGGWTTNLISATDWCRPAWYGSCDLNAVNGRTEFSPYTIIESVAPGDVWINEVNIYDGYDSVYYNLARTNQFIEIAAPIFADLTGWRINYIGETRNGFSTNTIYTFQGYEPHVYQVTPVNAMAFPTIQSPMSSIGTAAGKWSSGVFESDTIDECLPFALQLVSPLGVPVHSVVLIGTNIWASISQYYADRYSPVNLWATLNQTQPCGGFILAGEDTGLGSLSVISNTGRLSSDWQPGCAMTPGAPNAGQAVKGAVSIASSTASIFYPDESTSETLKEKLTTVADYNAFGEWAWNVVVNGNGIWISDIKSNDMSWFSFALGADTVITNDITHDDVKIESFAPSSTDGKFEFSVSVKDVNIGGGSVAVETLKENLKKVLAVEGAATLSPGGFSSDNIDITFDAPVDGKARFTVSPPADAGNSFFMRVKVK